MLYPEWLDRMDLTVETLERLVFDCFVLASATVAAVTLLKNKFKK
jgi:hypothetical protein